MSSVRSLAAEFEQEKTLEVFKDTVRASGAILFSRPDSVRWEITRPFHSLLVVSGGSVGKFEYIDGKRRALELGKASDAVLLVMDRIRMWFLGKFDDGSAHYDAAVYREPAPRIVLRPRDDVLKSKFREIEVVLAEDLSAVSRVTILAPGGDRTVMRFRERCRNVALPARAFSPSDPVEVDLEALAPQPGASAPAPSPPTAEARAR